MWWPVEASAKFESLLIKKMNNVILFYSNCDCDNIEMHAFANV